MSAASLEAFRKTRIYERVVTPAQWRADLAQIRAIDREAEAAASAQFWWIFACCTLAAIGLALMVVVDGDGKIWGLGLLAAGLFGLLASQLLYADAHRLNLENRRYELAAALTELLEADLAPGGTIELRLDFRPITDRQKRQSAPRDINGWTTVHNVDPFLALRGKLCDGTGFSIMLTEHLLQRSRWKRSASGKMKQKRKRNAWLTADLKLRLPAERARALVSACQHRRGAMQVPTGGRIARVEAGEKGISVRVLTEGTWSAIGEGDGVAISARDLVALPLVSLFQLLGQTAPAARSA